MLSTVDSSPSLLQSISFSFFLPFLSFVCRISVFFLGLFASISRIVYHFLFMFDGIVYAFHGLRHTVNQLVHVHHSQCVRHFVNVDIKNIRNLLCWFTFSFSFLSLLASFLKKNRNDSLFSFKMCDLLGWPLTASPLLKRCLFEEHELDSFFLMNWMRQETRKIPTTKKLFLLVVVRWLKASLLIVS